MPSSDPATLCASELLQLYGRKALSPVEVAKACLARIGRWNASVGRSAWSTRLVHWPRPTPRSSAGSEASRSDAVDGVPATIKDLVLTRGWPMRRGSLTTAGRRRPRGRPGDGAAARSRGRAARQHHDAGVRLERRHRQSARHVARNPWDVSRTPGGSSGGAGIAAALGMGALHVGTDGGGSIRIPSSFCGIVGLKPTFGRVPAWPLSPFGTVAHIGPMTRTVADAALMLSVLSRPDMRDWHALPPDGRDYRVGLEGASPGCGSPASADLATWRSTPRCGPLFEAALGVLAALGARVERVDPPVGGAAGIFARTWFPAATRLLEKLPAEQRRPARSGLVADGGAGPASAGRSSRTRPWSAASSASRCSGSWPSYDLLVTPSVAIAGLRRRDRVSGPRAAGRWMRLGRVQLPVQSHPAAGDQRAGGLHRSGTAGRAADLVAAKYARGAGAARGAGLRGRLPAADAGGTARGRV